MNHSDAHTAPSDAHASDAHAAEHSKPKSRWSRWKRPLTLAFFLLLIVLFTALARRIDWAEVFATLADFKLRTLLIAAALTVTSFITYACYDLIGRTYIRQKLGWRQILPVGVISYAFNLNLSAWVGGIAMRYRLYSRLGVSNGNIAKILGLSLATNWFGYMTLAGVVFSSGLVTMPPGWKLSSTALQGVGVLLLCISAGYLVACRFSKRRAWTIRGMEINLPSLRRASTARGMSLTMAIFKRVLLRSIRRRHRARRRHGNWPWLDNSQRRHPGHGDDLLHDPCKTPPSPAATADGYRAATATPARCRPCAACRCR